MDITFNIRGFPDIPPVVNGAVEKPCKRTFVIVLETGNFPLITATSLQPPLDDVAKSRYKNHPLLLDFLEIPGIESFGIGVLELKVTIKQNSDVNQVIGLVLQTLMRHSDILTGDIEEEED